MSQTETKLLRKTKTKTLDLSELKTVKWIAGVDAVNKTYDFSKQKYTSARQFPLMSWIMATIEMFVISIYLFIHSLPWPNWMVEIIHKIDLIIERILEAVSNKIEWWWDIFVIRLMWFRDSVEAIIDTFLSLIIFIAYKVVEFWIRIFYFWLSVVKFIFSPVIWVVKTVFPPTEKPEITEKIEKKKLTSSPTPVSENSFTSGTSNAHLGVKENETEETNHLSGTTSDCESDISAVSEAWSIGHTDKHGKSYNRLEMKATAEGKLRAAMYKRVKSQLTLMRKNSINFSRGMTSYAKEHLIPRVEPTLKAIINWIHNLAEKYGFADIFDQVMDRVEKHYLLSAFISFGLYVILIPINISNQLLSKEKKKSRRTRSMRSESLRRRTGAGAAVVSPSALEPYGLNQSKEPVVLEEPEFCNLPINEKSPTVEEDSLEDVTDKVDEDALRDSALASSVDDLYHMSDSNDGSNSLKDQVIHEEDDKEEEIKVKSHPKENGILKSADKSNQTKVEETDDTSETEINTEINKEINKEISKEIKKDSKKETKKEIKKETKKEIKKENETNEENKVETAASNNVKSKQLTVPQIEMEKPQSPQTRKKSLKETKSSNSEDGSSSTKSPKRKISFSLS